MSGNGRHRRPRQAPAIVVAAGVTGSAIAIPLLAAASANAADASTWDKVAACESGGEWNANLSNGYYGGLQISQGTWDEFGGTQYASRPDLASRSQQIAVAEKILTGQGSQTWASCADTAGLPSASSDSHSHSGGNSDDGTLGDALDGLLGGSHHSGGSHDSGGSGDTDATDPSGTPSPSATDGSADPDSTASSDGSGLLGGLVGSDGTATDAPDPSATPSGSASPGASHAGHGRGHGAPSATGGKHRATAPGSSSTDDGGFPLSVSHDNSGGVVSGSPTGGAGSIGNGDLPGVVRAGGAPSIHIPFAPQYTSQAHAGGQSKPLWQFPAESAWAGSAAVPTQDPADTAPGTPSGTPYGAHGTAPSPGVSGAPAASTVPGGVGTSGRTTLTADPSDSAATGGKHRGGAASETSGTSATPETGGGSQTDQIGHHVASSDSSSHDSAVSTGSVSRYTVRTGDSLSGIAASRRVDGGWQALYDANKAALGSDPDHIVPGQTLDLGAN